MSERRDMPVLLASGFGDDTGGGIFCLDGGELEQLDRGARHEVRSLQRRYVEHWVDTLSRLRPDRAEAELRFRAHAAFGLLNSTPHSARIPGRRPADGTIRGILEEMTWASLMS